MVHIPPYAKRAHLFKSIAKEMGGVSGSGVDLTLLKVALFQSMASVQNMRKRKVEETTPERMSFALCLR